MADIDFDVSLSDLQNGSHTREYLWDEEDDLAFAAKAGDALSVAELVFDRRYPVDNVHADLRHLCSRSALHTALEYNRPACVAVLVKAGANVNLASERLPSNVLEEVMDLGMPEVEERDLDDAAREELYPAVETHYGPTTLYGYDPDPDLLEEAIDAEDEARRERFLSSRYDPRPTPLLKALHLNSRFCVKLLLDAGAHANTCTTVRGKRTTPLTAARSVACVALLISAGAVVSKALVRGAIMGSNMQYLRLLLANVQALGPAADYRAALQKVRRRGPATGGSGPARRAKKVINRESRWRRRRALLLAREQRVAARDAVAEQGEAQGGGLVTKKKKQNKENKEVKAKQKVKKATQQSTRKRTLRQRR